MKTLLIAIIASICWLTPSYGQNSKKSAKEVWAAFEANPSDMYIFLDGLAESDNPKEYRRYIDDFVGKTLRRGVAWDVLFDEMKETVLSKDPDVAAAFCTRLFQAASTEKEDSMVMQVFPKNCSFDNLYVSGAVIYPGGKLCVALSDLKKVGDDADEFLKLLKNYCDYRTNWSKPQYKKYKAFLDSSYKVVLMHYADGTEDWGVMKYKGTDKILTSLRDVEENDEFELYIGYKYDSKGECIGEVCMGYDSFEKAIASVNKGIEAAGKAIDAEFDAAYDKLNAQIKSRLVKKYGIKAYNAMEQARPYVGMPEGIITEFCVPIPDRNGNRDNDLVLRAYAFSHTSVGGYTVYQAADIYTYTTKLRMPKYLYCRGGRVVVVKK